MLGPSDILAQAEDQDRGKWFPLMHPVTGAAVAISFLVTGPDSRKASEVAALMVDDLAEAADDLGRVRGLARADIHRRALARRVLNWKAEEAGQPVAFSHAALLRPAGRGLGASPAGYVLRRPRALVRGRRCCGLISRPRWRWTKRA